MMITQGIGDSDNTGTTSSSGRRDEDAGTEITVLCGTANMGNAAPTAADLEAWIPPAGMIHISDESRNKGNESQVACDLIVIGMQEATWKKNKNKPETTKDEDHDEEDSNDDDLEIQAQAEATAAATKSKSSNNSRPTMAKQPSQRSEDSQHLRALLTECLGENYNLLKEFQRGQMRLYLFVRQVLVPHISHVEVKAENTGIGGVYHNKGGILVQVSLGQTRLTFLTAHLAAHEGASHYKARNDNVREILRGARPNPKHLLLHDASVVSHHMFVMGDLNYRIRMPQNANDDGKEHKDMVAEALGIVNQGDFVKFYDYDELSAGIRNKDVLCQFQTLPCHFHPTFKMLRTQGFHYKTQRIPR